MNLRVVMIPLVFGALWDFITTFQGVADFFDLATKWDINPGQFIFGVVISLIIFGFVLSSHLIWKMTSQETPGLLVRGAWLTCIAIDLFTSWEGTRRIIFYDDDDAAKGIGIAVAAALIVASTVLLSWALLSKSQDA